MQSCQSLHCSHTCAKWAYIRHISSVNALTRLSTYRLARAFTALAHTLNGCSYGIFFQPMLRRALAFVKSCQNLYCSRTCANWAYIPYSFSQYSYETKYSCSLARAFTALTNAQNGRTYGIFHQSML